jgi:hypothetical protein
VRTAAAPARRARIRCRQIRGQSAYQGAGRTRNRRQRRRPERQGQLRLDPTEPDRRWRERGRPKGPSRRGVPGDAALPSCHLQCALVASLLRRPGWPLVCTHGDRPVEGTGRSGSVVVEWVTGDVGVEGTATRRSNRLLRRPRGHASCGTVTELRRPDRVGPLLLQAPLVEERSRERFVCLERRSMRGSATGSVPAGSRQRR